MVPTNLVEAERKGAKLVQSLAEADSPSNGTKDLVLSDSTNNVKKNANGHKEAGMQQKTAIYIWLSASH